jgi:rRNA maturation endonuclease Nob1
VVSTSIWKILPESQKPVEKKDLIERCPKCSTKIKKSSWKFCPECGNELKQETYEDQLNKLSKEELIELLKNK